MLDAAYEALKSVSRWNMNGLCLVQAQWITDGLRIASQMSSIYAVSWIHLYDEPPTSYGGLIQTDGVEKLGYAAWKAG